jgi:hypothetical protein
MKQFIVAKCGENVYIVINKQIFTAVHLQTGISELALLSTPSCKNHR